MDRMSFEIDLERRKADPTEPTVPGPVTDIAQLTYNADYDFPLTHSAVDPSTLVDADTRWARSDGGGNDANPGTFASQKATLSGVLSVLVGPIVNIALLGTFRSRGRINQAARFVSQAGQIATIEAPDTYGGTTLFTASGGPIANLPAYGLYLASATGGRFEGGCWNIPRSNNADYAALTWAQLVQPNWVGRSGAAVVTVFVKRVYWDPFTGLPMYLRYAAANYSAIGTGVASIQIPDSNVLGSPVGKAPLNLAGWTIETVDICNNPQSDFPLVALNYYLRTAGTDQASLTLYAQIADSTSVSGTIWTPIFDKVLATGAGVTGLENYATQSTVTYGAFPTTLMQYHTLKATNNRIYLMLPRAPAPGFYTQIIYPLLAWTADGTELTFSPPIKSSPLDPNSDVLFYQSRVCDIEYYNGLYYLSTDLGIYSSEDGLTGWALVFENANLVPRYMHICNNVLFVSAERTVASTFTAGETRVIYTTDGITWNLHTVEADYSGQVFSLSNSIIGITNSTSSVNPFRYFQEVVLWNRGITETRFENINIDVRGKCGSAVGEAVVL